MQVLEGKVRLHDAGGLHPGPQNILLRWDVGGLRYPVQVIQVAVGRRIKEDLGVRGKRVKKAEEEQDKLTSGTVLTTSPAGRH